MFQVFRRSIQGRRDIIFGNYLCVRIRLKQRSGFLSISKFGYVCGKIRFYYLFVQTKTKLTFELPFVFYGNECLLLSIHNVFFRHMFSDQDIFLRKL